MHKKSAKALGKKGLRTGQKNQLLFLFCEKETLLNKEKLGAKKGKRKIFTKSMVLR